MSACHHLTSKVSKKFSKFWRRAPCQKKIKNIYTSNIFNDSLFKFWVASQVNNGSKLIHGQHGGGYDLLKDECHFNQELEICDKYLTWGWSGSNKKIIPDI